MNITVGKNVNVFFQQIIVLINITLHCLYQLAFCKHVTHTVLLFTKKIINMWSWKMNLINILIWEYNKQIMHKTNTHWHAAAAVAAAAAPVALFYIKI